MPLTKNAYTTPEPDAPTIRLTWDRVAEENSDLSLDDLLELTANELSTDSVTVAEAVFEFDLDPEPTNGRSA